MTSSPEGRQEAAVLDAIGLKAAHRVMFERVAYGDEISPRDMEAAIGAYLSAFPAKPAVEVVEALKRAKKALSRIEAIAKDRSEKALFRLESIADEAHFAIIDTALQAPATPDAQTEVEK